MVALQDSKVCEHFIVWSNWSKELDTDRDLVFCWSVTTSRPRRNHGTHELSWGAPQARPSPYHPFLSLTIISGYYPIISAMSGTSWPSESLYKACLAPGTPTYLISYSDTLIISPLVGNIADMKKKCSDLVALTLSGLGHTSWSPNSTDLHLDIHMSTYQYKRHSRAIC